MQSLVWREAGVMAPAQRTAVMCQSLAQGLLIIFVRPSCLIIFDRKHFEEPVGV